MKHPPHKACQLIAKHGAPKIKRNISKRLDDFVKQCLHKKVDKRPSALELLQHPLILSDALDHTQLEPLMTAVLSEIYTTESDTTIVTAL